MNLDIEMSHRLAQAVANAGGRAYFVGGFVRDALLGLENKDIDIEVHGLPAEHLETILDTLGERLSIGSSFGIYSLRHYHLDIALPRSEIKRGTGHRDFLIDVDPNLGTFKAAQRRDFTINALMQDILSGEIIDHFGGVNDLKNHILRHVCADSFPEDPLRVLRAAQFAARFGFSIAADTQKLCEQIDLSSLSHERVFDELKKALLKAEYPSVFFRVLHAMYQLSTWFPEIEALMDVPQEPAYHPEGDVFVHTMLVLDRAAALRSKAVYPLGLMVAALCHDLGKTTTTALIDGRVHAHEHEFAGISIAERLLERLSTERKLKQYVSNMIALHMRPNALFAMKSGKFAYMKLFDSAIEPDDLLLLSEADYYGTAKTQASFAEISLKSHEMIRDFRALKTLPSVSGRDLIDAGLAPGEYFADALAFAHRQHLHGIRKDTALKNTLQFVKEQQKNRNRQ